jgi:hypothetical protein
VHNLWKAGFESSFLSLRILARDVARTSPLQTVASFSELPALEPPGSDSAGLSPIGVHGAREKCAETLGDIHTGCTVFPQHKFTLANKDFLNFIGKNERIFCLEATKIIFCQCLACLKLGSFVNLFSCAGPGFGREKRTDQNCAEYRVAIVGCPGLVSCRREGVFWPGLLATVLYINTDNWIFTGWSRIVRNLL